MTDVLVSTAWVDEHKADPGIRIVESNEDQLLYKSGHIPGAIEIDWVRDLNNPVVRDYVDAPAFAALCAKNSITPDTTVIFYGDKSNWWACYAFWVFQLYGHTNAKIMNGGRNKWEKEKRTLSRDLPKLNPANYPQVGRDDETDRIFRDGVLEHVRAGRPLVDVRSPEEYSGARLHMPDYPNEGALRGGHITGAKSVPWARAVNSETGEFKSIPELEKIYLGEQHLKKSDNVVAYCRIGERSSHTWFVLKHLLGFDDVRNYDGSWTEWGNSVGLPVEK